MEEVPLTADDHGRAVVVDLVIGEVADDAMSRVNAKDCACIQNKELLGSSKGARGRLYL